MKAQDVATPYRAGSDSAAVLGKAVLRVAAEWRLTQDELATLLGTSPASVSRLEHAQRRIQGGTEEQLALLLVRIFRSLDALVGGDASQAGLWLRADNRHLDGVPLALMQRIEGMVNVAQYLDALRGRL